MRNKLVFIVLLAIILIAIVGGTASYLTKQKLGQKQNSIPNESMSKKETPSPTLEEPKIEQPKRFKLERLELLLNAMVVSREDKYIVELKEALLSEEAKLSRDLERVNQNYDRYILWPRFVAEGYGVDELYDEEDKLKLVIGPFSSLKEAQTARNTLIREGWVNSTVKKLYNAHIQQVMGRNNEIKAVQFSALWQNFFLFSKTADGVYQIVGIVRFGFKRTQDCRKERGLMIVNLKTRQIYNVGSSPRHLTAGFAILPDQRTALVGITHDLSQSESEEILNQDEVKKLSKETGIPEEEIIKNLQQATPPLVTTLYLLDLASGRLTPLPLIGGTKILEMKNGEIYVATQCPPEGDWYSKNLSEENILDDIENIVKTGQLFRFDPQSKKLTPILSEFSIDARQFSQPKPANYPFFEEVNLFEYNWPGFYHKELDKYFESGPFYYIYY